MPVDVEFWHADPWQRCAECDDAPEDGVCDVEPAHARRAGDEEDCDGDYDESDSAARNHAASLFGSGEKCAGMG